MVKKKKEEVNTEPHTIIIDGKDDVIRKDEDINDRISRLYGEKGIAVKKETRQYSPTELADVRKKMLLLFTLVFISGIIILILLF